EVRVRPAVLQDVLDELPVSPEQALPLDARGDARDLRDAHAHAGSGAVRDGVEVLRLLVPGEVEVVGGDVGVQAVPGGGVAGGEAVRDAVTRDALEVLDADGRVAHVRV